ncbi:MAG: alcohol dehydrogenase catalytic domain-containing protein [Actinomycetota bacterium]|nr:alcohol dehydrogenase catalytic domain-containing protein [Actinomycetota bacterium]
MGHEFAGTVVEAGEGVDESWVGKKATVNPLLSCGECRMCRGGMDNLCARRRSSSSTATRTSSPSPAAGGR